ncbi:Bifunctional dethiobiotin synthetase/7,8-diamino-pelargonic acid aminotransferase, mitochondrial [Glycine soja]
MFPSKPASPPTLRLPLHLQQALPTLPHPQSPHSTLRLPPHHQRVPVVMASNLLADEEGVGPPLELLCKTLYAWEEAVSPHLATEREGLVLKDSTVLETLGECLNDVAEWGASKERLLVKLPVQDLLARFDVTCTGHSVFTQLLLGMGG